MTVAPCRACKDVGRDEMVVHVQHNTLRNAGTEREPRPSHRIECYGGPRQMAGSPCDPEELCFTMSELWCESLEAAVELWNRINAP